MRYIRPRVVKRSGGGEPPEARVSERRVVEGARGAPAFTAYKMIGKTDE